MSQGTVRAIFYYKNYYLDFFRKLAPDVQKKLNWTLQLIETLDRIPEKYFKYITGSNGIYEIRVEAGSNIYRVFCFFDKEKMIVLTNAYEKKTKKTSRDEIRLAEKLKAAYLNGKQ